jgi:hypothetical protein
VASGARDDGAPRYPAVGHDDPVLDRFRHQLVEHLTTQLPFALVAATASAVGYVLLGVTGSGAVGPLAAVVALAIAVGVLWTRSPGVGTVAEPRPGS